LKKRLKRFLAFVFSFQFSKLLILFETAIVAYLTRAGIHLAWGCINKGFNSSLPWVATMMFLCMGGLRGVRSILLQQKQSRAGGKNQIHWLGIEWRCANMKITDRLQALLSVKSIVTIILTLVFAYLSITDTASETFMSVYLTVVAFYFGTQYQKTKEALEDTEE